MMKWFTGYSAAVLLLFMGAAHQGYAWSSLFASTHHASANENHYHK